MEKNVGGADKNIRIVAGIAIIAAGIVYESWLGAVGLIPITTAMLGWCPPYSLFGISSCNNNSES